MKHRVKLGGVTDANIVECLASSERVVSLAPSERPVRESPKYVGVAAATQL
jgi:hypothetical protein